MIINLINLPFSFKNSLNIPKIKKCLRNYYVHICLHYFVIMLINQEFLLNIYQILFDFPNLIKNSVPSIMNIYFVNLKIDNYL